MSNSNTETRTDSLSSSDKAKGNEDKNKAKIKIKAENGESREIEVTNGHMAYLLPEEFTIIGHDTNDGEEHVLFDPRIRLPLDEAMIENIRIHGVITPVLCRRIGEGPLLIIDGQRRVRHAREYNRRVREGIYEDKHLMKVPFMMRSPGTDSVHIGRRASLNEVREDNGPLEKAALVEKLESFGMSDDEIAVTMGCTRQSVTNYRTLSNLPTEVRASLISNKINVSQAIHIARVDEKHRADALRMYESADGSSFQQTRHRVRQLTDGVEPEKTTPAPSKRVLRSMITAAEAGSYKAPNDMLYVIKWILGDIPSNDMTGKSLGLLDWFEFAKKHKGEKKGDKQEASPASGGKRKKKGDSDTPDETGKAKEKGKGKSKANEDAKLKEEDHGSSGGASDGDSERTTKKGSKKASKSKSPEESAPKKKKGSKKKGSKKKGHDDSASEGNRVEDTATLLMFPGLQTNSSAQSSKSNDGPSSKSRSGQSSKKK